MALSSDEGSLPDLESGGYRDHNIENDTVYSTVNDLDHSTDSDISEKCCTYTAIYHRKNKDFRESKCCESKKHRVVVNPYVEETELVNPLDSSSDSSSKDENIMEYWTSLPQFISPSCKQNRAMRLQHFKCTTGRRKPLRRPRMYRHYVEDGKKSIPIKRIIESRPRRASEESLECTDASLDPNIWYSKKPPKPIVFAGNVRLTYRRKRPLPCNVYEHENLGYFVEYPGKNDNSSNAFKE